MILIISDPNGDPHVDSVASELERRSEKYKIYNPATYPLASTLSVQFKRTKFTSSLMWDGHRTDLGQVRSVWYRRPGEFIFSKSLEAAETEWLRTEYLQFFGGVWANLGAFWVSRPENIRRASMKLLQLSLAKQWGFRIPRFIVTNDVARAKSFLNSSKNGVIVKTLGRPAIYADGKAATIYTHLLTASDRGQLSSVRYGPTFLQEFVPKRFDIRVTVVGNTLFAVAIDSSGFEEGRVDFRRAETFDLPHQRHELPRTVRTACLRLVQSLGLQFGAIDLILTAGGKYVFLEINPNGQWAWLEMITGVPITKALCDLLSHHAV
jgi:glutathione synthase/RimK-type ligase-like ATP-grasp enzyme